MNKHIKLTKRFQPYAVQLAMLSGASLLVAPFASAQDDTEDDIIQLSPFTVNATKAIAQLLPSPEHASALA